jgi:hypothetical protein
MRHIRVGALFWPDKFHDEPYLSMRGGWGCEGFSGGKLYLAEQTVDQEDGSFAGHTWLEDGVWLIDRMHDYEGDSREIYDGTLTVIGRYIPRRKLEYAVKRYWRAQMREAIRLGGAAG